MKRLDALTRQIQQTAQRVEPGAHSGIRIIKDEEFLRLQAMYQEAVNKNEHRGCPFQPLVTYQNKILRARPILAGEVGVYGNEILRLEPGYGSGQLVQVKETTEEPSVSFHDEESGLVLGNESEPTMSLEEVEALIKKGIYGEQRSSEDSSVDSNSAGDVDVGVDDCGV